MSEGLFSSMLGGILPPTVKPQLTQDTITLKITESEFIEMACKGLDARVKSAISIKLKEGEIVISVKII